MYEYLTVEEFCLGYENLTEPDRKKIIIVSKRLCVLYRLNIESNDLLNEAFERFLVGSRKLPTDTVFVNAFTYALKSIAQGIANKKQESNCPLSESVNIETEELLSSPSFENSVIENEKHIESELHLEEAFEFFKEDQDITLILEAKLQEMKPNEIIQNCFNGNKTQYETTTRRYRRGITKFLSLRNTDE